MSARDMMMPDQALADMLTEIEANITVLERRAQWPGAAHVVTGGAYGPVAAGSYTTGAPFLSVAQCSMSVDPGRWVFFASVSLSLARTSGINWPPAGELHTTIVAAGQTHTSPKLSVGMTGSRFAAITDVLSVESATTITATLSAGGNYNLSGYPVPPNPGGNFAVASSILVAFPA